MSGKGTSTYLTLEGSPPAFSSAVLTTICDTLLSVLTATVLPSRSVIDSMSEPFGTTTPSHACSVDSPASTPWEMIWIGRSFDAAMISDVVLENPI